MRITSSDLSFRLCAFSVLSARICHATSRFGTTSAVIAFAPSRRIAASRWPPLGVQKPVLRRRDGDDRIEENPRAVDDVGELLVVRVRHIALKRRRLDLVDRQHRQQQRLPAERIEILPDHDAAGALDRVLRVQRLAGNFRQHSSAAVGTARVRLGFPRPFFRRQTLQGALGHEGSKTAFPTIAVKSRMSPLSPSDSIDGQDPDVATHLRRGIKVSP